MFKDLRMHIFFFTVKAFYFFLSVIRTLTDNIAIYELWTKGKHKSTIILGFQLCLSCYLSQRFEDVYVQRMLTVFKRSF